MYYALATCGYKSWSKPTDL